MSRGRGKVARLKRVDAWADHFMITVLCWLFFWPLILLWKIVFGRDLF